MEPSKEKDVFRDTPVRLLGYANEVGEAFRSLVPGWAVGLSYAVASAYVVADTAHKSHKAYEAPWPSPEVRRSEVGRCAVDTLVWQGLASVAVPGFTINRFCKAAGLMLKRSQRLPPTAQRWTTTLLGLALIPAIIHPIDAGIHMALDASLRPALGLPTHYGPENPPPI